MLQRSGECRSSLNHKVELLGLLPVSSCFYTYLHGILWAHNADSLPEQVHLDAFSSKARQSANLATQLLRASRRA